MAFKDLKNNALFRIMTNKYVIIFIIFILWMFFFDENSYLMHRKFDREIQDLKSTIDFYKSRIKEDRETIQKLKDSLQLERFAREQYLMKKDSEDIYIIEFDTLKK